MVDTLPVNNCRICHTAQAINGIQPADADDTDIVHCARGHAFHRACLILRDHFRFCPEDQCSAHLPCFSKPLADRLAKLVLPYTGFAERFEMVVTSHAQQFNVSRENARHFISESEFLADFIRLEWRGWLNNLPAHLSQMILSALIGYFLLPELPNFFTSRNPQNLSQEEVLQVLDVS